MYTIRVYEKDTDDEWIFIKVADFKLAREIQHGLKILCWKISMKYEAYM